MNEKLNQNELNDLEELNLDNINQARYEVWLLCYDENDQILDAEVHIGTYDDPDPAVEKVKYMAGQPEAIKLLVPDNVAYVAVEAQTVAETEPDYFENVQTLAQEIVVLRNNL